VALSSEDKEHGLEGSRGVPSNCVPSSQSTQTTELSLFESMSSVFLVSHKSGVIEEYRVPRTVERGANRGKIGRIRWPSTFEPEQSRQTLSSCAIQSMIGIGAKLVLDRLSSERDQVV
jgi:hypothetical protein